MADALTTLKTYPRATLNAAPTPLMRADRLSDALGIELWLKRDDLTSLGFGGNKIRQLEYYLGDALQKGADTILITGAVQSNYVRCAAAAAAKFGMGAILQLEERVPKTDPLYRQSGNVLLDQLLGAELLSFPEGEDEHGADRALAQKADEIKASGKNPYIVHLSLTDRPLGALGYVHGAGEVTAQMQAAGISAFDAVIVGSGSGLTHGGMLAGWRANGWASPVYGMCVRRDGQAQKSRMTAVMERVKRLLNAPELTSDEDLKIVDSAFAPGYGQLNPKIHKAMAMTAQMEGIFLDPVYTGKAFAGLLDLVGSGQIAKGDRVMFIHTGGLPAIFAYQNELV